MNKHTILLSAIAIISLTTARINAQVQNVLLEQHTGAWCGWCTDGNVQMDEVIDLYGDQVIGVKIHNGDAMVIPEQSVIANALGLTGFPTASVNRRNFGSSVFLSRNVWKVSCESEMQRKAKAEVDCFYTLDKSTRIVRIQVIANIAEPMNFPLKFNAYIVEDNVTGVGNGYDQANYLSLRPGFENNPYYDQPTKIIGFHHMKVVRDMIGGAWGVTGNLPESVEAGDFYTYEFESEIDQSWNIDDVHFVGMLQADAHNNKEIINSAIAIENGSLLNRIIDSNAPAVLALPAVSDFNNVYLLENVTNEEQTYTVTLSTTDRTPADWSAEFTSGSTEITASDTNDTIDQIVVPANSTAELQLTLKIGSTLGIGDAKVLLELEGTPTVTRSRIISAITSEIENVLLETGPAYSMQPYLNTRSYSDFITLEPGDYLSFANQMPNVKLVIWNKGPSAGLSPEEIDFIKNTETVNHFICGDRTIGSLVETGDLNFFGLEWIGWNLEARGNTGSIRISGQQGDIITGNLGENIEGRLIKYYVNMVRIIDSRNVFPIMHFQDKGNRQYNNDVYIVEADDAIFGVRSTKNNTRTVLLGISPYIITDGNIRQTLVNNILDWLTGKL
ncbi:MAG: Omp28-related outer membrane protein [Planctomycetes bacterium]|nr:Omp28-related outer membrane protein [Planctomycetota bacterium]